MANVHFFFANPIWQANGTIAWNLPIGDRDNCWSFSARPFQANDRVTVTSISANSDNNLNQSTDMLVTMQATGGGGLVRLTATRVSP